MLQELHKQLQDIAGWNMYKLHTKHIEAGDDVKIKLHGHNGTYGILVIDKDKGTHTCYTPRQVHDLVRNLTMARYARC